MTDIIKVTKERLNGAGYHVDDNGTITRLYPEWQRMISSFIHIRPEPRFLCSLWHSLLFDTVFGQRFVPSPCQNCYKVVVKHDTVAELFHAYDVLKQLNMPSKCGLDGDRPNTDKLYASYFYNLGLDEGIPKHRIVQHAFPNATVILKRGCTEFEQACGPSDKWEVTAEQRNIEDTFFSYFKWGAEDRMQTPVQIAAIQETWIKKAHQWGDMTYMEFNGGEPLYQPLVTYHEDK